MSTWYTLHPADLPALLTVWSRKAEVLCPQKEDGETARLASWKPGSNHLTLEYVNLAQPPVDVLNGYQDVLFSWQGNERSYTVTPGAEAAGPLVVFGMRPCDTAALEYLDSFYLGEFEDVNYRLRRETTAVVACNCLAPGEHCFCLATGTGPFAGSGFDLLLTPDDGVFWVECASVKGEALVRQGAVFFRPVSTEAAEIRLQALQATAGSAFRDMPDLSHIREAMLAGFHHPLWEAITPTCLSCTGCTAVCPTCTCFQFHEKRLDAHSGERIRVKDSCQTAGFTRNAGWHNPRSKAAAVRHRLMDKLVYIEERFNKPGCVGCGRCIAVCPADIDIREIARTLVRECPPIPETETIPERLTPHRVLPTADTRLFTPHPARILAIREEAPGMRRYTVRYEDEALAQAFELSGQFFMVTVFGVGEVALSIPFGDQHGGSIDFCVKKVGKVTSALAQLQVGDVIGLRGPYGKGFPYRTFAGRDVLMVGSGVGLAPVRTVIVRLLQERERYRRIAIIASATTYEGIPYKEDLRDWAELPGVMVRYAVSKPTEAVTAHVGYINDLLPELEFDWKRASAILCASPRRIRLVANDLMGLGMDPQDIYTSLETHMRCGIGKCGHCKVGAHYVCQDGPVFTYAETLQLPDEF